MDPDSLSTEYVTPGTVCVRRMYDKVKPRTSFLQPLSLLIWIVLVEVGLKVY